MKGGLAMLYLIKPLLRWPRRFWVEIVVLLVLAMIPDAFAGDSLELLRVFQKNQMPGNKEIRESYTNFNYKPYEREELSFNILIPNHGGSYIEMGEVKAYSAAK